MDDPTTVIGAGLRMTGDITGDGDVLVLGRFDGTIQVGGEFTVGFGGIAVADVVATRVRVDGYLEGRVRATKQVAIGPRGRLAGEVQGLLAVAEGGVFQGRVDVQIDSAPTPRAPMRASPGPAETPVQPVPALPPTLLTERAVPILRLSGRDRSPTSPSAERPQIRQASEEEQSRAARRPRRLVTRRSTPAESRPTNKMPSLTPARPIVRQSGGQPLPDYSVGEQSGEHDAHRPHEERPKKGDHVEDRADLTDEWFLDEDEELRRR